jgi:NADH-quinone oxidoreductase subunit M
LSHLSLIVLAIYGFTFTGWTGAVFQILSHGVVDASLFLLLGALEVRYGSTEIGAFGGVAARLPRLSMFFVLATLAMIGLPMMSGFIGEFLILSSTFTGVSRAWTIVAALGVILGAWYMLWLVQRIFYGAPSKLTEPHRATDLDFGECLTLAPLVVLTLVMGLAPGIWLGTLQQGVHPPSMKEAIVLPAHMTMPLPDASPVKEELR